MDIGDGPGACLSYRKAPGGRSVGAGPSGAAVSLQASGAGEKDLDWESAWVKGCSVTLGKSLSPLNLLPG